MASGGGRGQKKERADERVVAGSVCVWRGKNELATSATERGTAAG